MIVIGTVRSVNTFAGLVSVPVVRLTSRYPRLTVDLMTRLALMSSALSPYGLQMCCQSARQQPHTGRQVLSLSDSGFRN